VREKLQERLFAIGAAVGYPFFYVVCFIVFATWTFPLDKVRDRIVASFNEGQRASSSSRELAIADISSSWVTGIRLTGVRLIDHEPPPRGDAAKGRAESTSELKVDSLVARVKLLPLLVGTHSVSFSAEAFGGSVSGTWTERGKDQSLDVTLEKLEIGQMTPLTQVLEVPIEGTLGGTITFELPEGHTAKANGNIVIEADDVALGDGTSKMMGKLAIPRLTLGTFDFDAEAKDGTVKVTKLGASGKDVDFLADGRIPLHEQAMDSPVDLNLRFRVSDAYRGKNDATKGLFGAPGSTIPGAIDLDPKMKQSKRADGFYTWRARGPLGKLDFSPGGSGGPASGPGGGGSGAATGGRPGVGAGGRSKPGP
jgi:type II secretion system protein N